VKELRQRHDPVPADAVKVFGVAVPPSHICDAARRGCGLADPNHVRVSVNSQNRIER
jgi:hypothetical protein